MNSQRKWNIVVILAALLTACGDVRSDSPPAGAGKADKPADARAVLQEGAKGDGLPEGLIVRVSACLGGPAKANVPDELRETWEFAANQVHRIQLQGQDGALVHRRAESRPFVSKNLCRELLDGKAVEIQARKGQGPNIGLVGSGYKAGSRSIEVLWRGGTLLELLETNGPALNFYRESDAILFGALYEKLAGQARDAFKATPPAQP